jgi:hypothetical protein
MAGTTITSAGAGNAMLSPLPAPRSPAAPTHSARIALLPWPPHIQNASATYVIDKKVRKTSIKTIE